MTRVAKVFELNRQGFNLRRGVIFAVILGLLIIVGVLPHERVYFLTAIFAGLSVALSDLGADYGSRVPPDGHLRGGRGAADGSGVRYRRRGLGVGGAGRLEQARQAEGEEGRQAEGESGTASTCSPRPGGVSGQGAVGPVPGTRLRATASMMVTNIGVAAGTANGRAFGQHGCDAASRASWLALTPRGMSRVRHDR